MRRMASQFARTHITLAPVVSQRALWDNSSSAPTLTARKQSGPVVATSLGMVSQTFQTFAPRVDDAMPNNF